MIWLDTVFEANRGCIKLEVVGAICDRPLMRANAVRPYKVADHIVLPTSVLLGKLIDYSAYPTMSVSMLGR
jgi:hypothetical protein